ncbi:glycosyltransferase family 4 protein [Planctomicrobium sp. SH527]|uniref:glycosyltransferase family 4 protein n=1 Tax=Planctomicrobium sp. SH527 TaxID=3448123 RepID=UPI003F5CA1A3
MPLKICIVALNAYPAIDPAIPGGIGGIETRSWMFARGLAARDDCEVTFVVRHTGSLKQQIYDGVRLKLLYDPLYAARESLALRLTRRSKFPFVRLRQPRLSDAMTLPLIALQKTLSRKPDPCLPSRFYQEIEADLFLTFGVQSNSATVIASAHASHRPAVLFLGSDGDLDERYLGEGNFVSTYQDSAQACRWAITHADQILCQTVSQQQKLQAFQRTAALIPNPFDLEEWDALVDTEPKLPVLEKIQRFALWVGRAENVHKRPVDLLALARRCPEIPFLVILNRRDDLVEAETKRDAPSNVHIIEKVPFQQMPALMKKAAVLVNTSSLEGFPNTYLQAAATGTPVASLNVEREFLERSKAGACADGDLDRLAQLVRQYRENPRPTEDVQAARSYVESHHSLKEQARQLATVLRQTASNNGELSGVS